jgi:tetratricopeptide (TPR) repeat protein
MSIQSLKQRVLRCMGIGYGLCYFAHVCASPYLPKSGTDVLEYLPTRNDPVQRELRELRTQWAQHPENLLVATRLAKRYVTLARDEADPRYLGYAEAALAAWWRQTRPPKDVLILRATVLQSTHRFGPALADLDLLLQDDPTNAQGWLTRATVLQVQGNGDEAKRSCAHLYGHTVDLVVRTCMLGVASLNGDGPRSYVSLQSALNSSGATDPQMRTWVLTLLAEMAVRLGESSNAERHFLQALSISPADTYLQGAYADFLLDQGRHREVIRMLKDRTRVDGLLLRYALALNAMQDALAMSNVLALQDRFEAATLRGDTVHQREQARFELHLRKNAERALALAQRNWQVQREPADVRIYLEAARAARDVASEKTILAWLRQTGLQDAALESMKSR